MQKGRFFRLLLLIAIILVAADRSIGGLMAHFYFKIRHGEQGRMTYVMDSVAAPVLVLGSSRAAHHYVPPVIEGSFGLGCYNTGKDQQGLFYSLAILRTILTRYHPKLIILDLNPNAFEQGHADLDALSVLLPYYRRHPEIRPIINKRGRWEWLKTYSSLYCYNSLPLQIIFNNVSAAGDSGIIDGYIPKSQSLDHVPQPVSTGQQKEGTPDTAIVGAFEETLSLASQHGCSVAVVVSPVYFPLPGGTSTTRLAGQLCHDRGIPFLDYSGTAFGSGAGATQSDPSLFSDEQHLDHHGAILFTRKLCADLRATAK